MKKRNLFLKTVVALLGVTFIYCMVNSWEPYKGEKEEPGMVIYYDMPQCHVPIGKAFGGAIVQKILGSPTAPFGHAGIIVEDSKGRLTQYQFGRFGKCFGKSTYKSSRGNWKKKYLGKRNGRSDEELTKWLAPIVMGEFGHSGPRFNAWMMKVDDISPVVNFITKEANDSNRQRYLLFADYTCGGAARDAFDKARCYPSRVINNFFDIVGNFIPLPSQIWSACSNGGNMWGLTGFSPEGNAPSLGTDLYRYKR